MVPFRLKDHYKFWKNHQGPSNLKPAKNLKPPAKLVVFFILMIHHVIYFFSFSG